MKKIVVFIGSDRKKGTYDSVQMFEKAMSNLIDVEFEYVRLCEWHLELCCGCKNCFDKGEDLCPLKDDRDTLLHKIDDADGVVFASPNYAFQVPARMKNLIDRIAYTYHRPRFFDKTYTTIVVQGVSGGGKVRHYLESTGRHIGFRVIKGCVINTLEPMTDERYEKMKRKTEACAKRYSDAVMRSSLSKPSLGQLILFRMTRSGIKNSPVKLYDYTYFDKMGWYESDYYYETQLGLFRKVVGILGDWMGRQFAKSM